MSATPGKNVSPSDPMPPDKGRSSSMVDSHDLLDPLSADAVRGDSSEILRRLAPSPDPVDQAMVAGWVKKRSIPGVIPMLAAVLTGDEVDVVERSVRGITLGEALGIVHNHISTGVALSIIEDVARILTSIHELDSERPCIHGQISLDSLILTPESEVWLAGFNGFRGDPQIDIQALTHSLGQLLLPKASKPGGAALLERLLSLRFNTAGELAQTINAHLKKQPFDRRLSARAYFTSEVLNAVGGARRRPMPPRDNSSVVGVSSEPVTGTPFSPIGLERQDLPFDPSQDELNAALEDAFSTADQLRSPAPLHSHSTDLDPATELFQPLDEAFDSEDQAQATMLTQLDAAALSVLENAVEPVESPFDAQTMDAAEEAIDEVGSADVYSAGSASSARDGLMAPAAHRPRKTPQASEAVLVGDYKVVAAIGKGGMGEIYLARSIQSNHLVALKVLGSSESSDEDALRMLMDEAAIMARIEHPHVLKVTDFGQAHGRYFLASEYLEGRPLVRVMIESYDRYGGMDSEAVACIGSQAARGLHAAHSATTAVGAPLNVVHRDVSPQNIFVTYKGQSKVIDFGVARAAERFSQTQVGMVKGKAAYMSPEQAEGRVLDARSDVFSLGVCLWEMVAGKRLFKRSSDYDTLLAVQTAPIESPSIVREHPEPALDAIIMGALRRDLTQRTASAKILAGQLEEYLARKGIRDKEACISSMMDRLFHDEAIQERDLVAQLEARTATDEEAASLRSLSGVSHHGGEALAITIVADSEALGLLDRYGHERHGHPEPDPREQTRHRVIRKVREVADERPPELTDSLTPGDETQEIQESGFDATKSPPSQGFVAALRSRPYRSIQTMVVVGVLVGAILGLIVSLFIRQAPPPSPVVVDESKSSQMAMPIRREDLVRGLRAVGARVVPENGPIQRVEGLGSYPFELDENSRVRWVENALARGWIVELVPRKEVPAVLWIQKKTRNASVFGMSINDCPAQGHLTEQGIEIDYGSGSVNLQLSSPSLNDVVLSAPSGADRLEIRPLALSFGRKIASSPLTHCTSGWGSQGRVLLRRLPYGQYQLTWQGENFKMEDQLRVEPRGVQGGIRVRGPSN